MRSKTGSAFLNALAVQRRRMQQGFQNNPDIGPAEDAERLADVGDLSFFYEGAQGADIGSSHRKT